MELNTLYPVVAVVILFVIFFSIILFSDSALNGIQRKLQDWRDYKEEHLLNTIQQLLRLLNSKPIKESDNPLHLDCISNITQIITTYTYNEEIQLWSLSCFKNYLKSELLSGYILDVTIIQDHLTYLVETYPDNQELMSIVVYLLGRVIDRKEDIHIGITPTIVEKILKMLEKYPKNTSLIQWSFYFLSLLIAHYSKWIKFLLEKNICKVMLPIFQEQDDQAFIIRYGITILYVCLREEKDKKKRREYLPTELRCKVRKLMLANPLEEFKIYSTMFDDDYDNDEE